MGLVVKFFTYFRDLSLKQSTQDPTKPTLMRPHCILLIMTATSFFRLFCSSQMECALEPRLHQNVPLCLSNITERNTIEVNEECSQCTQLFTSISLSQGLSIHSKGTVETHEILDSLALLNYLLIVSSYELFFLLIFISDSVLQLETEVPKYKSRLPGVFSSTLESPEVEISSRDYSNGLFAC